MSKLKITALVVGAIAAFFLVMAVTGALNWAWRYYTAPIKGKVGAEEQLESAPSRISKYNHFFDLCGNIQALQDRANDQYEQLSRLKANDTPDQDVSRVLQNINGIEAQIADQVRKYNQDARKDYTQARFHASKLPYQLPARWEVGQPVVSCKAPQNGKE